MLHKGLEPGLTKALRLAPLSNYHQVIIIPRHWSWPTTNISVRRISSLRVPPKENKKWIREHTLNKRWKRLHSNFKPIQCIMSMAICIEQKPSIRLSSSTKNKQKIHKSNKKHHNSEEARNTVPADPQFPLIPWSFETSRFQRSYRWCYDCVTLFCGHVKSCAVKRSATPCCCS